MSHPNNRPASFLGLAAVCALATWVALAPRGARAQAAADETGSTGFLDTVEDLDIEYDESKWIIDDATGEFVKIVFVGNVHFQIDIADMYSDQLEVIEGVGDDRRKIVATANPGRRVTIFLYEQDTISFCDEFVHFPGENLSYLKGDPIMYRVTSEGKVMKSQSKETTIQRLNQRTEITMRTGFMRPVEPAQERLAAEYKKRLTDFVQEMVKKNAAKAPKPKPRVEAPQPPPAAAARREAKPTPPPPVIPKKTPLPKPTDIRAVIEE